MTHPAAYLRRSHVDKDSPGDISREAQRESVRKLAKADGHNGDLVEYDDWGVSADVANAGKRTAYSRLLADMEAGRVSAVYAFDVDRLYRDPRDLIRLQEAAQAHKVTITTTAGRLAIGEGDDPSAEGFAFIGAVFGRMELQKAKKRARAARDARRSRGDVLGRPPYGYRFVRDTTGNVVRPIRLEPDPEQPTQVVIDAFLEAGSFHGAATLLNARKVPTQRGTAWAGNTVNRIVRRERPGLAPRGRVDAKVAVRGSQRFSRLLRCSCGTFLTPRTTSHTTKYGSYGPYISYQCHRGRHDPEHQRPYMVAESVILPWVQEEAARLAVPGTHVELDDADEKRAAIDARLERARSLFIDGDLSRERFNQEKDRARDDLESLEVSVAQREIPQTIDWSLSPRDVNEVLRSMWRWVELDDAMRPTRAEWVKPEWRSE